MVLYFWETSDVRSDVVRCRDGTVAVADTASLRFAKQCVEWQ